MQEMINSSLIQRLRRYQGAGVWLILVLLLGSFLYSFRNEFKVGDNHGNIILSARWESDERATDTQQEIRKLTINGQRVPYEKIYRSTFEYHTEHVVNPYYVSLGRYQIIELNVGNVQKLSFLQSQSPTSGILDIKLDGEVYTSINAYDEGWQERPVTVTFPSKYGISFHNSIWYMAVSVILATIYVFISQKYYQYLTHRYLMVMAISVGLLTLILQGAFHYTNQEFIQLLNESYSKESWLLALFSAVMLGALIVFTWHHWAKEKRGFRFVLPIVTIVGVSYLSIAILENGYSNIVNILPGFLFWNWIIVVAVYAILLLITHSIRWSGIILVSIATLLGIANGVMIEFRITPIQLYHFLQIGEARTVAEQFTLSLSNDQVVALMLGASLICLLLLQPRTNFIRFKKKRTLRIAVATIATAGLLLVGIPQIVKYSSANLDYWSMQSTYSKHGFLLALFNYEEASKMTKPNNYQVKTVLSTMGNYPAQPSTGKQRPNIIIIQNESQADFSNLENLEVSQDPLAFQHALNTQFPHGELVVSVFGGGTANTEYEVLTSNALGAGMNGMFPFQQLFNQPHNSVVGVLEEQGYETVAIHPYPKENYRREQVYEQLGFDTAYFTNSKHTFYELAVPIYDRGNFIADVSLFEGIRTLYERKSEQPLFTFVVTMQGHGGYKQKDYKTDITLNMSKSSSLQERVYLTSLMKSDQAFEELITYFREFPEPTVIVMYGDHQPALSAEFYDQFMDEEDRARLHRTPYIIWANFPLNQSTNHTISPNYLVPYLFELLASSDYGLSIPPYYQFLNDVMQEIPVYTTWGYQLANGEYVDELDNELDTLYRQAEYLNVTKPEEFRPYYE